MNPPSGTLALSAAELDLLGEVLCLEPPDALDAGPRRRGPATSDVRAGLAGRGLLHGSEPAAPVAAALRRLARAPLTVELHRHRPDPLSAVVAVHAGHAVLAVRHRDTVVLRRVAPDQAVGAVLEPMAPLRPASGRPVRIPVTVLTDAVAAAGDDADGLGVELMRRGMSGSGARVLVAANQDVDAVFRIGVALRGADGPRPGPYRITVQHNAAGHHCQILLPGPPDSLVTAPATSDRLVREVDALVRAAANQPDQRRGAGRGSTRPADTGGIGSGTGAGTWWCSGSATRRPSGPR